MLFILDTDHVSLLLHGNPQIQAAIASTKAGICTSIITAQELFNGWVVRINNAKSSDDLVKLYPEFHQSIDYLKKTDILGFTDVADLRFRHLLQENPPLRKAHLQKDIRIAAIALSLDTTVDG
jgi:tRNA(fMet)-specific endonuclease VapC